MADFCRALQFVLRNEGSVYTDYRHDNGGSTKLGITQATLARYLKMPVTKAQVAALTPESVAPIYEALYWRVAHCDRIGMQSIATMVMDAAVLCGPVSAMAMLCQAAKAPVSHGVPAAVLARLGTDMPASFRRHVETHFCLAYQEHLVRAGRLPTQRRWLNGWLVRVQRAWDSLSLQAAEQRARIYR